ncbi:hypothetical protein QUW41_09435 [Slackia piriformis]|nr:hypothetical protein [Slackia piriformis]
MNDSMFKIANGRVFSLPGKGWKLVNPEDAPFAATVCAVEVRNAPAGTPHFAVFVQRAVCELRRHPDLDAIDAAIAKVYPGYQTILDARVDPVFERGLKLKNYAEWARAPRAGYFDLSAWPEYWAS